MGYVQLQSVTAVVGMSCEGEALNLLVLLWARRIICSFHHYLEVHHSRPKGRHSAASESEAPTGWSVPVFMSPRCALRFLSKTTREMPPEMAEANWSSVTCHPEYPSCMDPLAFLTVRSATHLIITRVTTAKAPK